MNLDAIDWEHFNAYMGRSAGRMPIVCLLSASFLLGLVSLSESDPDGARQLVDAWRLATVAGYEIGPIKVTFIMAFTWVTVPFVQAFKAFLPLGEVWER